MTSRLWPKEHGAYAQLAFPLATGLTLAPPSAAAVAMGAAATTIFLANEPLAVFLGVRGRRVQGQLASDARRRAMKLVSTGAFLGCLGIVWGWPAIWPEILFPVAAGSLLVLLARKGMQKTLPGEILVLTAFSTLVLPLAAASGADPRAAMGATGVWWVSFLLGTLEVHAIKARAKKGRARYPWTRWVSPVAAGLVLVACLGAALGYADAILAGLSKEPWDRMVLPGRSLSIPEGHSFLISAGVAALPPAGAVFLVSLVGVHPRSLKRVGWTLVGANVLAFIALVL